MNINLSAEELSSAFKIDLKLSDKAFLNSVDLVRKEYKVSQENFCKMVGISRALYTKAKKGDKGISSDNKLKMLRELAKIKELSFIEENAARMTISDNTSKGFSKYSLEKSVSEQDAIKEMKEALWKTVQAKQKLKRNSEYFQPSLEGSIDKITLFVRLVSSTEKMFLSMMDRFGVVSGNTKYTHNARYKNSKVTEYAHIWQYEGSDCKVHIQYMFYDKRINADVRELKVEFNPNKWNIEKNEILIAMMPFLSKNPRIKEFDVCKDYLGLCDTNIIMPKELFGEGNSSLKVFSDDGAKTVYFGDKNKTVNLMIYDKRKEILKKDNKDIGFNCLRAESRYKLKPNEWKKGSLVEYRIKLSDVDKVKLPIKTYSCQAHMLEAGDIDSNIKSEDKLLLKAMLNGGLNLYNAVDVDTEVARRLNSYLDKIYIENLTINYGDVAIALNAFVYKYLDCINRFYDTSEVEGLSEIWRLVGNREDFEGVGLADWDNLDDIKIDTDDTRDRVLGSILLTRDETF